MFDYFATHGGRLSAAQALYPNAPRPWLDLSTGINPWSYPFQSLSEDVLSAEIFARLPEPENIGALEDAARQSYAVPDRVDAVAIAGSDLAISLLPRLVSERRRVVVLGPTYTSHENSWRSAGHDVVSTQSVQDLQDADIAVIVNPNNPDGRVLSVDSCCEIAEAMTRRKGLMIIDEAFCECSPDASLVPELARHSSAIVLRSFGKFYGLAGLRLGFVLSNNPIVGLLRQSLGDWPVSGPAIEIGQKALSDVMWADKMREKLTAESEKLDSLLRSSGFDLVGGTSLFRLVRHQKAGDVFARLLEAGILVRPFDYEPTWLRFGLTSSDAETERLSSALRNFDV